jgi:TonB family protein
MMWLADHSLRVLALISVVGLGSVLARKASAHSRLFAWTVVLYVAASMPVVTAVLPDVPLLTGFNAPEIVVASRETTAIQSAVIPVFPTSTRPSAFSWLLALYLTGAIFLLARVLAGTYLTARINRSAHPVDDQSLLNEVDRLSSVLQLRRRPRVRQHSSVHVPFVCGLLRPSLLLPETWESWDAEVRRAVLTHELSHIARRDLWTMRVASMYRAITWINPISWWLSRRIETLADRASDEAVLASGVEPTAYAELLVRFLDEAQRAPGRANWQLAMARRGELEATKRIGRVLSTREGGNVRLGTFGRVLIGSAVVFTAVPAMVLSASQADNVTIQEPNLGLDLRQAQVALAIPAQVVTPTSPPVKRIQVKVDRVKPVPVLDVQVVPALEQEPEPWRSTRQSTAEDTVAPQATLSFNPKYTSDAMRAKIQGRVKVEIIVSPEGNVTAARVVNSLDQVYGLDDEAVKTAKQWKFLPGTYQGQAVALRAVLDFEFRLH